MSNDEPDAKAALSFEEVAAAALVLAAEPDAKAQAARFLSQLQAWAAPSAVLCVERDAGAEAGWRLLPDLCSGAVPYGAERSLAKLLEEAPPAAQARPTRVRPPDEIPGFKVRDTWVVPWSHAEASGFLVLRGISSPYPPNFGDAVALLSQPLWPRLSGRVGAVRRLTELAREIQRVAERLEAGMKQELERVSAEAAPAAGPEIEQAHAEAGALRGRLEELEKKVLAREAELEEKLAAFEKARGEAEAEREFAKGEAADLRGRLEMHERRLEAEQARAEQEQQGLRERAETAEKARAAAEAERDGLRTQANQLWSSIESLQRQIEGEKERFEAEKAEAGRGKADADREREEVRAALAAAEDRAKHAEELARDLAARWETTVEAFREAAAALRRTPFVPPALRVSFSEAEKFLEGAEGRPPSELGCVLFLDRDMQGLERLAPELEAAGVEVLIAHYPEEVAFYLKTPDARHLAALVCDVMALRSDQNLTELVKSWRQDLPGLALLLSFKADNPTEAEKAQRIPSTFTAGYLPRPLQREALVDALGALGRRQRR